MKNLDLNNFGVSEMNQSEMNKTDGGVILAIIGWAIIAGYTVAWVNDQNW